jgi:hypothetical protein
MFTDHRESIGFKQSGYDPALFTREAEGDMSSISTRTKHITARYFWCRAKVNDGKIILVRCDTTEQVADALTKVSRSSLH